MCNDRSVTKHVIDDWLLDVELDPPVSMMAWALTAHSPITMNKSWAQLGLWYSNLVMQHLFVTQQVN